MIVNAPAQAANRDALLKGVAALAVIGAIANQQSQPRAHATASSRNVSSSAIRKAEHCFKTRPAGYRRPIQQTSKQAGYYHGRIDGLWGTGTAAAYERAFNGRNFRACGVSPTRSDAPSLATETLITDICMPEG